MNRQSPRKRVWGAFAACVLASATLASDRQTATLSGVVSNGLQGSTANSVRTIQVTGGYTLGRIGFSGTLTSTNANTWLIDSRILVTPPSGPSFVVQPFVAGQTFTAQNFSVSAYAPPPQIADPAGTWTLRFYELLDNGGTASPDATWNLTVTFTDDPPPAPASTNLGILAAPGPTNQSVSLGSGQVKWFRFTLGNDVRPGLRTYLDIDTVGTNLSASGDAPNDLRMALYTAGGALIAADDDSGPGFLCQMSFGAGGRSAILDGAAFDGQSGPLAAGTYYLAVGAYGTTFGPLAWSAVSTSGSTGTVAVRLRLNPVPTCPADFNGDNDLNPDDLGDFITCYFSLSACPAADYNGDGDQNPDDLGDFITGYFAGC